MHKADIERNEREASCARAVRGDGPNINDEIVPKVKAEYAERQQASNEARAQAVAGYWEGVRQGLVPPPPGQTQSQKQ